MEVYLDNFIKLGKFMIGYGDIFFLNDFFYLILKFLLLKKNSFNSIDNLVSIFLEIC